MNTKLSKLRILFVSHAPRLEGAERSLLQLVEELTKLGKIKPLVVTPKSGKLRDYLDSHRIPYICAYRYPWWIDWTANKRLLLGPFKFAWNFFSWILIRQRVKRFDPDVVYINTLVAPFGWIIAKDLKKPFVWHIREFIPEWLHRDYDFGRKWSLEKVAESSAVVANSNAAMRAVQTDLLTSRIHVVYNGIHCPPFDCTLARKKATRFTENSQTIRLLVVGSVNANKDQATVVRALRELIDRGICAELVIVGEFNDHYGKSLNALIVELGVRSFVRIVGWQPDVVPFYREADLTVIASHGEPFGRTVIESMSCGTPVVATAAGGVTEIMERVNTALLFPVGDHQALADNVAGLINDTEYYLTIAAKGHAVVQSDFNVQQYVNKMSKIFESVARQSP